VLKYNVYSKYNEEPDALTEWNMRLTLTERGQLGWVDHRTQLGDKVALLLGCTVPVILRPRKGGGYHVVGNSIICGLMDGEGLKEDIGDVASSDEYYNGTGFIYDGDEVTDIDIETLGYLDIY
jgi:hypothetical protein